MWYVCGEGIVVVVVVFFTKPSPWDPLGRECDFGDSEWEGGVNK